MNVLVTGACGYIGSSITDVLRKNGHCVTTLDSMTTNTYGKPDIVFELGYHQMLGKRLNMIDTIVHCAASISNPESTFMPLSYYENNLKSVMSVVQGIKDQKRNIHLIFASSAAAWVPGAPYGESKRMGEKIIRDCASVYNFEYTICRFFNVTGVHENQFAPSMNASNVLREIILAAKRNEVFEQYGNCIRDYVHVTDIANLINRMVEGRPPYGGPYVYDVGSGKGTSTSELLDIVSVKPSIKYYPDRRMGDVPYLVADTIGIDTDFPDWRKLDIHTMVEDLEKFYA